MAKRIQLRDLVSIQDIGDIVALVMSARKMLARRGEQAAHRLGRGVRDSHILEEFANFADRSGKLIARKQREFRRTSEKATERVKQEIQESPVRQNIEEVATNLRDKADQTTYQAARQIVERHEQRHSQDGGDAGVFVLGAILGVVVGVVAALWYAPQSGEETRHEIERAAEETRRRVEGESLHDAIQEGKTEARKFQEISGR
jgi:gas vesicle protein